MMITTFVGHVRHMLRSHGRSWPLRLLLVRASTFSPPSALPLSRVCRSVPPTRSRGSGSVKSMSIAHAGTSSEDVVFREEAKKLMAAGEGGVALWLKVKEEASRALLKEKEEASRALLKEKEEASRALLKEKEEASRALLKEKEEASRALLKEKEEASRALLKEKDARLEEKDKRLADRDEEIVVLKGARQAVLANRFLVEQTAVRYSIQSKLADASTTDICQRFVWKNLCSSNGGLTQGAQKHVDMLLKSSTSLTLQVSRKSLRTSTTNSPEKFTILIGVHHYLRESMLVGATV